MDAFAVSVCKGLSTQTLQRRHYLIVGAWFGGFQALMPTLGYLLGSAFEQYITSVDHWVAFILLSVIGGNMLKEAFSKDEETTDASFAPRVMLLLAVATSIDALAVGITLALLPGVNIVAAVLFGFGIQMNGGPETKTAQVLEDITGCIMKTVKLITYYAPIGFFGFFANLVSTYGPELVADYSRTLIIYYVMSFVYMFVFFPIYAQFGGGKGGAKIMFSKLFRPAAVSFGTCSSVATIPTNMEVADETGISKDVTDIVLPMGATMHMDGSAMSAIIKVAFLFGVFGLDFTTEKAILAIIVAVFSSVAMSGIPGGGGTGELVVCTIFFPDQLAVAYPIALAIGNLVDPPATMVNSAGDYVVSFIVSRYVDGKDWLQKAIAKKRESKAIEQ